MMVIYVRYTCLILFCFSLQIFCVSRTTSTTKYDMLSNSSIKKEYVILDFLEEKRRPAITKAPIYQEFKKGIIEAISKNLTIVDSNNKEDSNIQKNLLNIQIGIIGRKNADAETSTIIALLSAYPLAGLIPITSTKVHEFSFIVTKKEKKKVYTYYSENRFYFGTIMIPLLWINFFTDSPTVFVKPIMQTLLNNMERDGFFTNEL